MPLIGFDAKPFEFLEPKGPEPDTAALPGALSRPELGTFESVAPTLTAVFERGNPIVAAVAASKAMPEIFGNRFIAPEEVEALEEGFDPVKQAMESAFAPWVGLFSRARTQEQWDRVADHVQRTNRLDAAIVAGGPLAFAGFMGAGFLSPEMWGPAGAARGGFSITKKLMMFGGGAAIAQEAIFHIADPDRSLVDSAIAVTAITMVSGIIGKGIQAMGHGVQPSTMSQVKQMADDLEGRANWPVIVVKDPVNTSPPIRPVAEVAEGATPPTPVERTFPKWEVARAGKQEDVTARPKAALGRVEQLGREASESLRARTSPNRLTRETSEQLNEAGFVSERAARGEAVHQSVESIADVKRLEILGRSIEDRLTDFVSYRQRVAGLTPVGGGRFTAAKIQLEDVLAGIKREVTDFTAGDNITTATRNAFNRTDGPLSEVEFNREIGLSVIRGGVHDIPEVAKAAQRNSSEVFGKTFAEAISVGLIDASKVALNKSNAYLHRVYLTQKIIDNEEIWDAMVIKELRRAVRDGERRAVSELKDQGRAATPMTEADFERIAKEIREKITGTSVGRTTFETLDQLGVTARGALQDRTLGFIDDEVLVAGNWLDLDIDTINRHYLRSVVPDTEIFREFGSVGMEKQIKAIADDWDLRIKGRFRDNPQRAGEADDAYQKRLTRYNRQMQRHRKRDIAGIEAGRDLIRGTYKASSDPNALINRVQVGARNFNSIRLMGGAMISSMSDIARASTVHGFKNAFGTAAALLRDDFALTKMIAEDSRIAGTYFEMLVDTRGASMYEIADSYARGTAFERGLHSATSASMIANGLAPWNHAMKQWSHGVVSSKMLNTFDELLQTGKISNKRELEAMLDLGINEADAVAIARKWRDHGATLNEVKIAQMAGWGDDVESRRLRQLFATAINKDVNRVIVTPGKLDKPLFMNKEFAKTVFQFKSFAFAANNRILLSNLQNADQQTLNGIALAVATGMGVYAAKQWLNDRPMGDLDDFIWNGIDRSAQLGVLADAHNTIERFTGYGIPRMLGMDAGTRYMNVGKLGAFAGPTGGLLSDIATVALSPFDGELSKRETNAQRNMLPGAKFWYTQKLTNALGEIASR